MSPTVVALQGHTGRIGEPTLKHLIEAQKEGKIKLVVVHRPGSDVSKLPSDVETRELDLATADESTIKKAVQGLQIYLSVVGIPGMADQAKLIKPLAETPGFVTFIPPGLGHPYWTTRNHDQIADERIREKLQWFGALGEGARKQGLSVTPLQMSVFTDFFFQLPYLGTEFDKNVITLPKGAESKRMPFISAETAGQAFKEIVIRDPSTLKNKFFHTYDYNPTGQEIIDAFTKVNGSKPTIKSFDEDEYNRIVDSGDMMWTSAVYRNSWMRGEWPFEGERLGKKDQDFLKLAEEYKAKAGKEA